MGKRRNVAYVVFRGHKPGIYRTWAECEGQVTGFPGNSQKGYETLEAAERAWQNHISQTSVASTSSPRANIDHREFNTVEATPSPIHNPARSVSNSGATPPLTAFQRRLQQKEYDDLQKALNWSLQDGEGSLQEPTPPRSWDQDNLLANQKPSLKRSRHDFEDDFVAFDEEQTPKRVQHEHTPDSISRPHISNLSSVIPIGEFSPDGEPIVLTPDQEIVINLALRRHNIFLTGAGGCGKTVTLKHLLFRLKKRQIAYQVVAPTGIAALPLGGKTAHAFLGWKPGSSYLSLEKLLKSPKTYVKKAVRRTEVLIIEEVSMVENNFLERMNLLMQHIMADIRPFGGKQLIILGDFHQLPPVKPFETCMQCGLLMPKDPPWKCEKCPGEFLESDRWAFKAPVWTKLKLKNISLKQIHRQKSGRFQDMLNKIRNGITLDQDEWADLEAERSLPPGVCAVKLMSLRESVDAVNRKELAALRFAENHWNASDGFSMINSEQHGMTPWDSDQPLRTSKLPEVLTLKVGAKVVLLSNLDQSSGLVNGSQGRVIGYEKREKPEDSSKEFFSITDPDSKHNVWRAYQAPIVLFTNGLKRTIDPIENTSQHGTNYAPYLATRVQIPLSLAWALTIHKSQGMTLQYVEVSKKNLFEPGQLYVALSRATSLEGLIVSGFSREQLPIDKTVCEFYRETDWEVLPSEEEATINSNVKNEVKPEIEIEVKSEMESGVKLEIKSESE